MWPPPAFVSASQWAKDELWVIQKVKGGGSKMEVTTIAIDLAKNVFALCGADAKGRVVLRKELRRAQLPDFMRRLGPCVVGMEASGGAHYWARQLAALGHEVRLISPSLVTPYRNALTNIHAEDQCIISHLAEQLNAAGKFGVRHSSLLAQ